MANTENIDTRLLLAMQRALLGAVPPCLRSVSCDWNGAVIRMRFIFDGEIDEDDRESASIAATEVIAELYSETLEFIEEYERLDYPADRRGRMLALLAYERKERTSRGDPFP